MGTYPVHGKWVLLDYDPADEIKISVLAVGDDHLPASSPRKKLDVIGTKLLMPLAVKAFETGQNQEAEYEWGKSRLSVRAIPRLSARNNVPVAVQGIVTDIGSDLPPQPPVGVLEWFIHSSTGEVSSFWDDGLFQIYDLAPKPGTSPTGDMMTWLDTFVYGHDKWWFKRIIAAAISLRNGQRHLVSYEVETGAKKDRKRLELSAWMSTEPSHSQGVWARGVVQVVDHATATITPGIEESYGGDAFHHAVEMIDDQVFLMIDTASFEIYLLLSNVGDLRNRKSHERQNCGSSPSRRPRLPD